MNSTMLLSTDTLGHTLWVDVGWPACDERLVTVAEANKADRGTAPEDPETEKRNIVGGGGWG